MNRRRRIPILCGAVFAGFLLMSCGGPTVPDADAFREVGLTPVSGDIEVPDIRLVGLDGTIGALSELQGDVVFLNFWASWCPPCRAEMPAMSRLNQSLKGQNFAMAAVNVGEQMPLVESFVREFDIDFPVYLDEEAAAATEFGVTALPTTILLDRKGRAVAVAQGALEWDDPAIVSLMREWTR